MISVWVFLVLSGLAVWVQGTQPFSAPATVRSASSTSTPSAPIYEEHTINLLAQIGKAPDVEQLFVVTEQIPAVLYAVDRAMRIVLAEPEDAILASHAIQQYAMLTSRSKEENIDRRFEQLTECVELCISALSIADIARYCWGLTVVGIADEIKYNQVLSEYSRRISQHNAEVVAHIQSFSNSSSSGTKRAVIDELTPEAGGSRTTSSLDQCGAGALLSVVDIANMIWTVGCVRDVAGVRNATLEIELAGALESMLLLTGRSCQAGESRGVNAKLAVRTLWALALFDISKRSICSVFVDIAMSGSVETLSTGNVISLLWSQAKLGWYDSKMLLTLVHIAQDRLDQGKVLRATYYSLFQAVRLLHGLAENKVIGCMASINSGSSLPGTEDELRISALLLQLIHRLARQLIVEKVLPKMHAGRLPIGDVISALHLVTGVNPALPAEVMHSFLEASLAYIEACVLPAESLTALGNNWPDTDGVASSPSVAAKMLQSEASFTPPQHQTAKSAAEDGSSLDSATLGGVSSVSNSSAGLPPVPPTAPAQFSRVGGDASSTPTSTLQLPLSTTHAVQLLHALVAAPDYPHLLQREDTRLRRYLQQQLSSTPAHSSSSKHYDHHDQGQGEYFGRDHENEQQPSSYREPGSGPADLPKEGSEAGGAMGVRTMPLDWRNTIEDTDANSDVEKEKKEEEEEEEEKEGAAPVPVSRFIATEAILREPRWHRLAGHLIGRVALHPTVAHDMTEKEVIRCAWATALLGHRYPRSLIVPILGKLSNGLSTLPAGTLMQLAVAVANEMPAPPTYSDFVETIATSITSTSANASASGAITDGVGNFATGNTLQEDSSKARDRATAIAQARGVTTAANNRIEADNANGSDNGYTSSGAWTMFTHPLALKVLLHASRVPVLRQRLQGVTAVAAFGASLHSRDQLNPQQDDSDDGKRNNKDYDEDAVGAANDDMHYKKSVSGVSVSNYVCASIPAAASSKPSLRVADYDGSLSIASASTSSDSGQSGQQREPAEVQADGPQLPLREDFDTNLELSRLQLTYISRKTLRKLRWAAMQLPAGTLSPGTMQGVEQELELRGKSSTPPWDLPAVSDKADGAVAVTQSSSCSNITKDSTGLNRVNPEAGVNPDVSCSPEVEGDAHELTRFRQRLRQFMTSVAALSMCRIAHQSPPSVSPAQPAFASASAPAPESAQKSQQPQQQVPGTIPVADGTPIDTGSAWQISCAELVEACRAFLLGQFPAQQQSQEQHLPEQLLQQSQLPQQQPHLHTIWLEDPNQQGLELESSSADFAALPISLQIESAQVLIKAVHELVDAQYFVDDMVELLRLFLRRLQTQSCAHGHAADAPSAARFRAFTGNCGEEFDNSVTHRHHMHGNISKSDCDRVDNVTNNGIKTGRSTVTLELCELEFQLGALRELSQFYSIKTAMSKKRKAWGGRFGFGRKLLSKFFHLNVPQ